jgi:hypothetical protein
MAETAQVAEAAQMAGMPPMLAYTIRSPIKTGATPFIRVGQGNSAQVVRPNQTPADNSYWIVILDATKPATKVQEWVVPGQNNTTVPSNLDQYMSNPGYLFAVVTQVLANSSVPQGPSTTTWRRTAPGSSFRSWSRSARIRRRATACFPS